MKKVGILTEHRARNFGSCLQAYALQTAINQLGHKAEIVDYRPIAIENSFGVFIVDLYEQAKGNIKSVVKFFINLVVFAPFRYKREKNFKEFRDKYFSLSSYNFEKYNSSAEEKIQDDVYVCGSDQIWNPKITYGLDPMYFAYPMNKNAIKISYAASIGLSDISDYAEEFKKYLEALDVISVREVSAQKMLNEITDKKVSVVLDPTLLLKKEDWISLFEDREKPKDPYILVYSLKVDEEMVKYARELSDEKGLPVIFFDLRKRYGKNSISKFTADPIDFIYYLYHADYVVTNSFHGTVFSVIFEKKFVCVPMQGTSSRMIDLLNTIGLNNRLINDDLEIDQDVDYQNAKLIIKHKREESLELLNNAIERGCFE